jgi:CrcB protein
MKILIWVFLGGGLGSSLRYGLHLLFKNTSSQYPIGTFAANLIGCLLIGIFFGILHKLNVLKEEAHFFFIVGFTGGLTTFSSFALDNVHLFKSGSLLQPLIYSLGSIIMGILLVFIGLWFSKSL